MPRHLNCTACHSPQHASTKTSKTSAPKVKDVLDIRIVPGNPNNAWIECYENTYDEDAIMGIAEVKAREESAKLGQYLALKEEKLRVFQEEVRKRVAYLQKVKREEARRKNLKMVEDEHNLVVQRTLGIRVPYKGNPEDLETLNKELLKSCIIPCQNNPNSNDRQLLQSEVEESDRKVEVTAEEIKNENVRARSRLLQRRVDDYDTSLPGGEWKSPKRDPPAAAENPQAQQNPPVEEEEESSDSSSEEDVVKCKDVTSSHSDRPAMDWLGSGDAWIGKDAIKSTLALKNPPQKVSAYTSKPVTFLGETNPELEAKVNYIYRDFGKEAELEKVQKRNQFWKYRKIFMDIERDQVQEKKKLEDHRRKVQQLKLAKEQERKTLEKKITQFTEKPLENIADTSFVIAKPVKGQAELEQEKEMYRYMEALRKVAKERTKICGVDIPPLCACAATFWDSHPDKCANNCVFYKNVKVYVSALTSALANTR